MKILKRNNLIQKMKRFNSSPVSIISAPSGFGKTTCTHTYLEDQENDNVWFSMYGEYDEEWAWKRIVSMLKKIYPKALIQDIAIPTSRMEIADFTDQLLPHLSKPLYIVIDDVDITKIPKFIQILKSYSFDNVAFLHFIVITQNTLEEIEPLNYSHTCTMLYASDFVFTKEEVARVCRNEVPSISDTEIELLYQYSNGWIITIQLALESYRMRGHIHNFESIHDLIKKVLFGSLEPEIQESFMKLSILKEFSLDQALDLCENQNAIKILLQLEHDNFFIQMLGVDKFRFISLFKEYLTNELRLSSLDTQTLYKRAANYLYDHENPLEAISMYMKFQNYDEIIHIIDTQESISLSDIAPQLMIHVFETLPEKYKNENPYLYLKWIMDCITNFPQLNGPLLLEDFKNRIDHQEIKGDIKKLYGEYYFIHAFTYFNNVEKMIADFILAYEYFDGGYSCFAYPSMITTFGSYQLLFLYYRELGTLQNLVAFILEKNHYFIHISKGVNTGTESLVNAEYHYETGQYNQVRSLAIIAYQEAISKEQFSIAICSLFLQGRLALIQFNQKNLKSAITQLQSFYKKTNIPILHGEIDCALSHLYILNSEHEKASAWLINGELENGNVLHEASITPYIVYGVCLIKQKSFSKLYMIADILERFNKQQSHILGLIYASIFKIIAYYEDGQRVKAMSQFKTALNLCKPDHIISPLVELSFAYEQIIEAYSALDEFEDLVVKSCHTFLQQYNQLHPNAKVTPLSKKEKMVLSLIAQNYTAKDISKHKEISINTVQTHMKTLYKKIGVKTKVDAVRFYENNREEF